MRQIEDHEGDGNGSSNEEKEKMDHIREKRLSREEVCDRIRPKQDDEDRKRNATWRAKNSGAT